MNVHDLKIGDIVKTTLSKDRGKAQVIIAICEDAVSFSKLTNQYIWVPIEYIKPYHP
jgi:phenylpyruvate tautomerase PptA (4-oxalocrotonate tautomerase family)